MFFKNYITGINIFSYENDSPTLRILKNINFDIILLLLESFNILCDSDQGYYKYSKIYFFFIINL